MCLFLDCLRLRLDHLYLTLQQQYLPHLLSNFVILHLHTHNLWLDEFHLLQPHTVLFSSHANFPTVIYHLLIPKYLSYQKHFHYLHLQCNVPPDYYFICWNNWYWTHVAFVLFDLSIHALHFLNPLHHLLIAICQCSRVDVDEHLKHD